MIGRVVRLLSGSVPHHHAKFLAAGRGGYVEVDLLSQDIDPRSDQYQWATLARLSGEADDAVQAAGRGSVPELVVTGQNDAER